MKITSSRNDGHLYIFLSGELDHHGAKDGFVKISAILDEYMPQSCIIDMSGLTFMDSSGIALVLRVYKTVSNYGGATMVQNPSRQPFKVLEAAKLERIVKILCTTAEGER